MRTVERSSMQSRARRQAAPTASLRRLDWRFLLTGADRPFDHLVWPGATPELEALAVDLGVARHVSRSLPGAETADALVITQPANVPAEQASRCLKPGGSGYYELGRGSAQAVGQRGRSTGEVYWTTRGARRLSAYLPTGQPGLAAWYAAASPEPLDRTTRWRLRAGDWLPQQVLARLPLATLERAAVVAPQSLAARLGNLVGDGQIRWAVLTPGTRDRSSVVFLPFERGRVEPLAVVKTVRAPEQTTRLYREQTLLQEIRVGLSPELRSTIPRPLGLRQVGPLTLSIESNCPGRALAASSGDRSTTTRRKLADLRLAAVWLTELHRQARAGQVAWTDESIARWVAEPIRRFQSVFGSRSGEQRLFAATRGYAEQLVGKSLPLVRQHNDFDPWNVHRLGDRVGVFDWERSQVGPALADLLYFATIWSSLAHRLTDRRAQARDFERLYLEPLDADPAVRAVRDEIAAYMAVLGIDRPFLPLVLVMTVLERALDSVDGASSNRGDPRTGNRQVGYLDVLARGSESLFSGTELWSWAR